MNKDAENSFYLYVTMASNQETGVISKKKYKHSTNSQKIRISSGHPVG